jgi:protocatechuate 3,4-dioxygenase beta subunit
MILTRNKYLLIISVLLLLVGIVAFVSKDGIEELSDKQSEQDVADVSMPIDENGSVKCSGELTIASTEGPYYKSGSPETKDITGGVDENAITLQGYVLDTNCRPITNAWVDFWQADNNGNYDLAGYKFRGHQYTDENGKYTLQTVIPAGYSGRTPHIHVKVRASEDSSVLTTQLYFPGEAQNRNDSIFRSSLVVDLIEAESGKVANFNFILKSN